MNYLQRVLLFMSLANFITCTREIKEFVSYLSFPFNHVDYKDICNEVIITNLPSYGEETVFYDFYLNFTDKDKVDLGKLERSFNAHF